MNREEILAKMKAMGAADAKELQEQAAAKAVTETEIIAREEAAPRFDPNKDYTAWPVRAPVRDECQVWLLLQPHNAAHYTGRPSTLRALWGLAHTTDPKRAKPYVAPYGVSGLYYYGECCRFEGAVYRSIQDDNPYSPAEFPAFWDKMEVN